MICQMSTYRIFCDGVNCEHYEEVTILGSLEGDNFDVEGWSMEKEHTRGGSVRSHFCPKCTKDSGDII